MSTTSTARTGSLGLTLLGVGLAAAFALATPQTAQAQMPLSWSGDYYLPVRASDRVATRDENADEQRTTRARTYRAKNRPSSLGGPKAEEADATPPRRTRRARGVQVASLSNDIPAQAKPRRSLSGGGGISWIASSGCLNGTLRGVLAEVASRFGSVTVNSTCRSRSHNAAVGGATRSMHLTGDAADFRVHGNYGAASSYMRGQVGGFKHYGGGLFHIDTGPKRTW